MLYERHLVSLKVRKLLKSVNEKEKLFILFLSHLEKFTHIPKEFSFHSFRYLNCWQKVDFLEKVSQIGSWNTTQVTDIRYMFYSAFK